MIFNPLFLSESSGSQILAPKQSKMSNNKYLFSDIVKVVMNPVAEDQTQSMKVNSLTGNNIGLTLDGDQKPVQLNVKLLSEIDNEEAKLSLAEILPAEIAQLLLDPTDQDVENAVSYISTEPLQGELQNFVNNLIGTELIAENINSKSGLLLSLEDSKSAVNLELAQIPSNKSLSEKIVVQTLVVPEKSKLISLMGDVQNKNGLFRIDNSQLQKLGSSGESPVNSNIVKPTLSVYSLNYGGEQLESLSNSIKNPQGTNQELNLVQNSTPSKISVGGKDVQLDKISFIPSSLKNTEEISQIESSGTKPVIKNTDSNLKLVKPLVSKSANDFNVSKITIVKKNLENPTAEKIIHENVISKKMGSELKHLEFGKQIISGNSSTKNISYNQVEVQSNNESQLKIKNSTLVDNALKTKSVEGELINNEFKGKISKLKNNTQPENIKEYSSKTNPAGNNTLEKYIGSDVKNLKVETSENSKVNNSEIEKVKSNSSEEVKIKITTNEVIKEKNNIGINANENLKTGSVEKNNLQQNIASKVNGKSTEVKNDVKNIPNRETEIPTKNDLEQTLGRKVNSVNELLNSNDKKMNSIEQNITTQANPGIDKADQEKIVASHINKKVSVKVKGGIKTVSEKVDSNAKINTEQTNKETSTSSETKNENSSSNEFSKTPFSNTQFNMQVNEENSFKQFIGNNEVGIAFNEIQVDDGVEAKSKLKIVKSAAVLKEVTQFISKQEKGSLSFDIRPEELGKMKITLDNSENVVRAKIEVESEQAKQLIEKNLDKLQEELAESGVELNSLNISLSYSKQQNEENGSEKNDGSENEDLGQVGEAEEKNTKTLGYNTYEYLA